MKRRFESYYYVRRGHLSPFYLGFGFHIPLADGSPDNFRTISITLDLGWFRFVFGVNTWRSLK